MIKGTVCALAKRTVIGLGLIILWGTGAQSAETDEQFFESKIRPILVQRCEGCHSTEKGKTQGGLALDSVAGWMKGGEAGPALVPGDADSSLLIQAVRYQDGGPQMPPEEAGGKLNEAEIKLLTEWVQRGAHDPRIASGKRGGLTEAEIRAWWSFQPVQVVTPPPAHREWNSRNEIDHFVHDRLARHGLSPSLEADRRTLIRRVTYDLTGLPPTPDEVAAFVSDDRTSAYDELCERLLQSPQYGERWGRHWLDLVRYADTAGENTDHPISDAWRYRNWVIDAFNRDLPYDEFVRQQLAGDLLHADDTADQYARGVTATGFLAIARRFDHDSDKHMHLTFEDTIDTVGKAFLGMTLACARCHDHKYDPVSARDYYAIYGILNSTRFAFPGCEAKQQPRDLIPLLPPADWARTIEPYDRKLAEIDGELKQLDATQTDLAQEFQASTSGTARTLARGKIDDGGSQPLSASSGTGAELNAVEVQRGQLLQLTIDPSENYGADTTIVEWELAELGDERRHWNLTQDVVSDFLVSNPHPDRLGNQAVWLFLDGRGPSLLPESVNAISGQAALLAWRRGDNPAVFVNASDQLVNAWTTLPARTLFVHPAQDRAVAIGWVSPISGQVKISGRVADGHPGGPNGVGWHLQSYNSERSDILARMSDLAAKRQKVQARRIELVAQAPVREMAYAVTEGAIGDVRMHLRGDPEKLGEEIPRRWLEMFGATPVSAGGGSGRQELAHWLTDPSNPLTARVMVNRIWQHHFGKGLVQTPNDFGTRGQTPSHPELLDWLATRFIEAGWSVKAMHRLILQSATYRQATGDAKSQATGDAHSQATNADPNNILLWRFDRQRLDAEELRDTLLTLSQQLDPIPGTAYALPPTSGWSFSQHVPFSGVAETNQRSIYQMTLRNRRPVFMGLFDGADPNATTPLRQVTTVPTQSLYFLNDPFFHAQAEKIAQRVLMESEGNQRVAQLYRLILQRSPTPLEEAHSQEFLTQYAAAVTALSGDELAIAVWSALTRVVLSSNEFLYLD